MKKNKNIQKVTYTIMRQKSRVQIVIFEDNTIYLTLLV